MKENKRSTYQKNQRNYNRNKPRQSERRGTSPSFFLGQVFSLIYNLAVLFLVYTLVQQQELELALKIFFGNLGLIAFATIIARKKSKTRQYRNSRRSKSTNRNFEKNHYNPRK